MSLSTYNKVWNLSVPKKTNADNTSKTSGFKIWNPSTWFGGLENVLKSPEKKSNGLENYVVEPASVDGGTTLNEVTPEAVATLENFHQVTDGVVKDGDGNPIIINGKPYIYRFDHGEAQGKPKTYDPFLNNSPYALTPHNPDKETVSLNTIPPFDKLILPSDPTKTPPVQETVQITDTSSLEDDVAAVDEAQAYVDKLKASYKGELGDLTADKEAELANAYAMYASILAMLDQKYGNMMKLLGSAKSTSEQRAAINHAKLLKYLPTQLKSMGLGSLGTSQSAYLKAFNAYNNQLSEALRDYRNGSLDAENAYTSGLMSAMQNYNSMVSGINSRYSTKEDNLESRYWDLYNDKVDKDYEDSVREDTFNKNKELTQMEIDANKKLLEEDRERQKKTDNYNYYMGNPNDLTGLYGVFENVEAVQNYLNKAKDASGGFNEDDWQKIEDKANEIIKYMEDEKSIEEDLDKLSIYKSAGVHKNVGKNNSYINDTVKLDIDGKIVKVTLGNEVSLNSKVVDNLPERTVFIYDGTMYYKTPDGKVVEVADGQKRDKLYNYAIG